MLNTNPVSELSRRAMLKRVGIGAGAVVLGGPAVLLQTGCGPKVNFWVATIEGALIELKPLLPSAGAMIDKAIAVARDFAKAYAKGDFANAVTIFKTLAGNISTIAADLGASNPTVKIIIATAGVALRAIAVLLEGQGAIPAVSAAAGAATGERAEAVRTVRALANAGAINRIFATVKP